VAAALATITWGALVSPALAVPPFDIPAQPLADSLRAVGSQTHTNILFDPALVAGREAPTLKADLTTDQALSHLLADTGIRYEFLNESTVVLASRGGQSMTGAIASLTHSERAPSAPDGKEGKSSASEGFRVAQVDQGAPAAASSRANSGAQNRPGALTEVVVTAQKTAERIQDVPVPVSALSGNVLAESNQVRLSDYYTEVPSLNMSQGVQSAQSLTVRGLGANVLVDEVPLPGQVPDLDPGDLARVEVLRGPQGTLYGYSGLGGVVKFVTREPSTDRVSGRVEGGLNSVYNGEDLGYYLRGSVNVPLGANLAIRASGFTRQDAGYIDNPFLDIKGINKAHAEGGRLSALWQPSEAFSVRLSALYQVIRGGNPDVDLYDGLTLRPLGDLQQSYIAGVGPYERKLESYSAVIKAQLGRIDLMSITGYNLTRTDDYTDATPIFGSTAAQYFPSALGPPPGALPGTPDTVGTPLHTIVEGHNLTQEIRLSTSFGHLDVLVGGFYRRDDVPLKIYIPAQNPTTAEEAGLFAYFDLYGPYTEYAGFADLTYHFTERFDVQIGGRLSQIGQDFNQYVSGPYVPAFIGGTSPSITPTTHADSKPFTYLFTPRFRVSQDLMVYARFASAFLPGGTNPPAAGVPPQYGPETSHNYEVGAKGDLLEHRLTFDASVYLIDFKGMANEFYDSATQQSYTANAGDARSKGVELSVTSTPTDGLHLAGWVVFADAKLTSIPQGVIATGAPVAEGDRLPDSYKFAANASLDQDFRITSAWTGFVGATVSYIGDRQGPYATTGRLTYPPYAKADLRAGVRSDLWTALFYVTNVADRRGMISGDTQAFIPYSRYYIQPRTYGLTVSREF
jgi:outer membrane receptor protein involved in Fe transport